jgi:hypothetical protein
VYNIDESGLQPWADAHDNVVIAPRSSPEDEVAVAMERHQKRVRNLVGIKADGSILKSLVIVPRKSIEIELDELGHTPDQVIYAMHESGFINSALFEVWSKQVLFPDVEETRTRIGYERDAHLLLDECSCHSCDVFLDECTGHWIVLHLLPAHSSDQTQPLDLGIFGLQKSEAKRLRLPQNLNP